MAEKNVNHIHNLIYFFTPPDQKAPTANPDCPNLFNILSAATNLVKDNLFNDNKQGFKFKIPDHQVEALKNWDTGSIDKNNPKNQDNYLEAIRKIMKKDKEFIRKCSDSGVSEERINKIKIYTESEYIRLETNIINQPLQFVSHKIKLQSNPKDVYTEGDVARKAYEELQKAQRRERKPDTRLQKAQSRVERAGKGTFNAVRGVGIVIGGVAISAGETAVRALDGDSNVNSWRFVNDPDGQRGNHVDTNRFHLKPTLFEKFKKRAEPASTSFGQKEAAKESKKFTDGFANPNLHVMELLRREKTNKQQLGQLYGLKNGSAMHKSGHLAPGGSGGGGR